jgi:hypothetical protein
MWEAVFDAATFPRATLLDAKRVVGYLHPLPPSDALAITLDAPPATLPQANAIALAWGHHLAALVHDITGLLADVPTTRPLVRGPEPAPPGMLRQTLAPPRPDSTPAWAPLLGAAHITHRGVWDFSFPSVSWARVAVSVGREVVLMVPREMPLGATAWAQVMRLALEVLEGGGGWHVASGLTPPMVNPVRITEARGAEARILPSDFEEKEEKGTLFDRFRHAF